MTRAVCWHGVNVRSYDGRMTDGMTKQQERALARVVELQAAYLDAKQGMDAALVARNQAIRDCRKRDVTEYMMAKQIGVSVSTVANAINPRGPDMRAQRAAKHA